MASKRSAKVAAKTTREAVREETVLVPVVAATDHTPAAVLGDYEDKENEGKSQDEAREEETPDVTASHSKQEGEERKRKRRRKERGGGEGYKRYVFRVRC
jgi:hypothetical protein